MLKPKCVLPSPACAFLIHFVSLTRVVGLWFIFLNVTLVYAAEGETTTTTPVATPRATLSMSVSTSPTPAIVNAPLTYKITVFPTPSDVPINGVVFTYGLPQNFNFVSAQSSQGQCNSGRAVECNLGTLVGGATITLVVTPTTTGAASTNVKASGTVADTAGSTMSTSISQTIEVTVNKPAPVQVGLGEAVYTVAEADKNVVLTVARTGESDRAISVDFMTTDGTANAGRDYVATTGTLVWTEGDTQPKTITVKIFEDFETEDDETFTVSLFNPQGASVGLAKAQVTVVSKDVPGQVSFSADNYLVSEKGQEAVITVLRTDGNNGELTVDYVTANGTAIAGLDYEFTRGTLRWANGDVAPKIFTVKILSDALIEGNETIVLTLTNPSNRATFKAATATVTIVDFIMPEEAVATLTAVARNPTQRAIAKALGRLCQSGRAGTDLQARCTELVINAGTRPDEVSNALQQLAPEEYATQGPLTLEGAARQVRNINSRLMALRSGTSGLSLEDLNVSIDGKVVPFPTEEEFRLKGQPLPGQMVESLSSGTAHALDLYQWGVFVNGNISFGDSGSTERQSGFDFDALGLTAGFDYRLSDTFLMGVALGYNVVKSDLSGEGGHIDLDGLNLSVYGTFYHTKLFYLDMLVSYGMNDYDNDRNVIYAVGDTRVYQTGYSSHGGDEVLLSFSGGYHFPLKRLVITPTLRLEYIRADIDGFNESMSSESEVGSGLGVAMESQALTSMTWGLGVQLASEWLLPTYQTVLIPQFSLEWLKENKNGQRDLRGYFLADAGHEKFTLQTDEPDNNYLNVGLGITAQMPKGKSAFLNFEKLLAGSINSQSIMVGIRLEF